MKAHIASLINALILITMSGWGYLESETPSVTALIPAFVGVALLVCNPGVKSENKVVAHVAVLLTLLILFGLGMPLSGVIGRGNTIGIVRVLLMMASTIFAMVFFVKSFIDARKRRSNAS